MTVPGPLNAQCDRLLVEDVFRALEQSAGPRSTGTWHQAWCGGTFTHLTSESGTFISAGTPPRTIPVALPLETAREFQGLYRRSFCEGGDPPPADLSQEGVVRAVASPAALDAYERCRAVERRGLEARFVRAARPT